MSEENTGAEGAGDAVNPEGEAANVEANAGAEAAAGAETAAGEAEKPEGGEAEQGAGAEQEVASVAGLELPDDYKIDEEQGKELGEVFSKYDIKQEAAQALIDMKIKSDRAAIEGSLKAESDALDAEEAEWEKELKEDTEFGGENFEKNLSLSEAGWKEYGGEEALAVLVKNSLHKHPALVRFGFNLGKSHDASVFASGDAVAKSKGFDAAMTGGFFNK